MLCAVWAGICGLPASAVAAQGNLDVTFGTGGKATVDFGGAQAAATAAALQPDGKLVVAGWTMATSDPATTDFAVARLNIDGTLDTSFGTGGKVTTDFYGDDDRAFAVAIQGDGRIVVAGRETGQAYDILALGALPTGFALARFTADGQLDASFGSGGRVTTIKGASTTPDAFFCYEQLVMILALSVQADGKILAAGMAYDEDGFHFSDVAVARYDVDGSLDPTWLSNYDADGSVKICIGLVVPGVRIVDTAPGVGDVSNNVDYATSMAILPGGNVLIGGTTDLNVPPGHLQNSLLMRFLPNGVPDPAFGTGGAVSIDMDSMLGCCGGVGGLDQINALAVRSDGTFLTAGLAVEDVFLNGIFSTNNAFVLARYAADATIEGIVNLLLDPNNELYGTGATDLALAPRGQIAAVGTAAATASTSADFRLVVRMASGAADETFGAEGQTTTDFFGFADEAAAVQIRPDGRPVVAGTAWTSGTSSVFAIAQYESVMAHDDVVDLDGDGDEDVFLYNSGAGGWAFQNSQGAGFTGSSGAWSAGWSVTPAHFNADALADVFLFSPTSGQWFRMLNTGNGFTADGTGFWWPGWQRHIVDLDGDGLSDVFLWDAGSGTWFKCLSTGSGFTYIQGFWSPGWELYPVRFNGDTLQDFFLFNRSTGQWFWALGASGGGFSYPQTGFWSTDFEFHPADFNGDRLSDLLLHRPATGQWFVATPGTSGFAYTSGFFSLGWSIYTLDLDANGQADLFLHNPATGQWFALGGDGAGHFSVTLSGFWSLGWTLYPADFDGDGYSDILLYNPTTGVWFRVSTNHCCGFPIWFSYISGFWDSGLTVIAGSSR